MATAQESNREAQGLDATTERCYTNYMTTNEKIRQHYNKCVAVLREDHPDREWATYQIVGYLALLWGKSRTEIQEIARSK